jgi:hypothetical protein
MATIIKCDRCNFSENSKNRKNIFSLTLPISIIENNEIKHDNYDLCQGCIAVLIDTLKPIHQVRQG